MNKWYEELFKQYHEVMRTSDYKDGGNHEIEVSPYVFDCLRINTQFEYDFLFKGACILFNGMFKIKFVNWLPDVQAIGGPNAPPRYEEVKPFRHLALRVEKHNGRFVYFDWDENLEEMK